VAFNTSNDVGPVLRLSFDPPVVVRSGVGLAEPHPATLAYRLWVGGWSGAPALPVRYSPDAPSYPRGYRWAAGYPADLVPLPGPHAVLKHQACLGESWLQQLEIGQCVITTTATLDTSLHTVVQRFRVPRVFDLAWIEVATAVYQNPYPWLPATVSLHDAGSGGMPPPELPPPLAQADFPTYAYGLGAWTPHAPFATTVRLEPGRDYWLAVRTGHECALHARALTGAESFDFTDRIGELWSRTSGDGAWTRRTGEALCFKLVGLPSAVIGVPPAPRAPLALRVSPNPVRGEARVAWSGAAGRVRFEVHDARGRRVGGGASGSASGGWTWRVADDSGTPLAAGVYFVRATDESGRTGRERVVVVR
jgi:hypothetical protein